MVYMNVPSLSSSETFMEGKIMKKGTDIMYYCDSFKDSSCKETKSVATILYQQERKLITSIISMWQHVQKQLNSNKKVNQ